MRCRNLLLMIAAVAAWRMVLGPAVAAQPLPEAKPSRNVAAQVEALIRKNASNTEIVTFADRRQQPVRIVRGKKAAPGPAVPAVSAELPAASVRRPVGGDVQVVSFTDPAEPPVTVLRGTPVAQVAATGNPYVDLFAAARGTDLDRVAFAVDGAESSHGADPAMWRPEPSGPQGPMQVSAAAAADSGGGDRFDLTLNRLLGRAYLGRLFRRYGNWPDAVSAYNWGPGNMDAWIAQGRPPSGFPLEVERYRNRVLSDGGIPQGPGAPLLGAGPELRTP
jgi:Transglycosylase SLT domain